MLYCNILIVRLLQYKKNMNAIKTLIRNNLAGAAILLYIVVFMLVQYMNPSFLYNEDGSLREFGVGYSSKTILPIWLIAIILGILSYVTMYYISLPAVRVFI
jgi:hypothetical protein